ncbi:MAG: preprotein translocase subunit SecA [Bacteroidetes bacterium MED-G13]|nr:MAG: preprotein translocase subunit SecA [Bacteroidetes bacterium MED-G13]
MIGKILKFFVGDKSKKDLKLINPIIDKIHSFQKEVSDYSNDELRAQTINFKTKIFNATSSLHIEIDKIKSEIEQQININQKESLFSRIDKLNQEIYQISESCLEEILPKAFAVVKETASRFVNNKNITVKSTDFDLKIAQTKDYVEIKKNQAVWKNNWDAAGKNILWDMIHYDVQLIGGVAMHQGKIAEMQTGEGKTLVATLPVYLNALTGRGVHLVTVNDYLAKRDSAWMAPIFEFHGLSVDCIDYHKPNSIERKNAYNCDITYGTNNEFGFDYLRDNMANSPDDLVQRKHNYAIVDEVDSVLIDDARTPLIISGPIPKGDKHEFNNLKPKIEKIVSTQRKFLLGTLSQAKSQISNQETDEGAFNLLRVFRGIPKNKALIKYLSEEGIKQLLQKTENFYMQDNNREMPKIDKELYYVIDEKNNQIELTDKGIEFLSGKDDPNFFIMPEIGMEISKIENKKLRKEDEAKEKDDLYRDFGVKSERIHSINQLLKAYALFEKDIQYVVMNNKVLIVDEQTGRIMDGRRYSDGLHQAIEAKENVKIEAATQTFATITLQNYFRMYNKLSGMTGTAITEAGEFWEIYKLDVIEIPTNKPIQRDDKEDIVFKTKREKYNAVIDNVTDLSKSGRPVLIGTTSVEISELLGRMLKIRKIPHNILNAKLHKKESDVVAEAGKPGQVTIATNMAGRGTDIKLIDQVKDAGGLAIIGTERHDSRRVDRQLRGRSGRQGDPGSSQFYVSLEDNLMRLFGAERIAKMMDRMGLKEGEVIQHSMITNSIERAQKKVEENNFGIRKRLLEYDDVMNAQREVVYRRRNNSLSGERLRIDISNMIYNTCENITSDNKNLNDFKNFEFELIKYFSITTEIDSDSFESMNINEITEKIYKVVLKHYMNKIESNAKLAFPVIKHVYENQREKFKRIVVPFSDGVKTLQVITNLEKAFESGGNQLITDFEKNITLAILDNSWKNHLRKMDELKQSVQLAVHEQKDPLLIYKFEAFELFKILLDEVNKEILSFLFKAEISSNNQNVKEAIERKPVKLNTSKEEIPNSDQLREQNRVITNRSSNQQVETIVRTQPKVGRNDRVSIKNVKTGDIKELKYKHAENLISSGEWIITNK